VRGLSGRPAAPPERASAGDDLYRQIFERNRTVQLLIDPATGRVVDANPAACRFYGYSRDELTSRKASDLNALPPSEVAEALARAASGAQSRFHFPHRLASGEVRKVEVEAGPVEMDGRVLLYSVVHDVSERHEVEAELNRTISLLQSTFESTTDGILVIDPSGRILSSNQRFAQMWRIPAGVLEASDNAQALALARDQLEDPHKFMARVKELQADPDAQSFDMLEFKDGRVFERYSMPQRLNGVAVGRVWSFRDVTERRQAEEALRQSEEKYREILAGIAEGYYEVNLRGCLTFFNDALGRILGYRAEEMQGMSWRRFIDHTSARQMHRLFRGVYATAQPVGYVDWKILRKGGSPRYVSASVSLMRDERDAPCGFRGVVIDVSERRQAEEALRESEERYRHLVELSPDGIAIHREGRLVFCNPAGARMLGYQVEEVLGKLAIEFVHPASRQFAAERMQNILVGKPVPFIEEKFVRKDGSMLEVEVGTMPFTFQNAPAIQVIIRDITERKRAEKLQAVLYRIAQTASAVEDVEAFYEQIHGIVGELMYARNFYIALYDEAADSLSFPYFVDEVDPTPLPKRPGKGLTEYVLRTGEPLLATPQTFAELVAKGETDLIGGPSVDWLGVPLKRGEKTFGVLVVQSYTESMRYGETDRDLLTFVSQHVASAIDRKRAAEALRESEGRFRTLAETAPSAIFIYQGAGFIYANASMAALTGYAREELGSMNLWDMVHPDYKDLIRGRGLARLRGDEAPTGYQFKIVRKDGEERWVDFSAAVIDVGGRPAVLGTAFDITKRKEAEEQIKNLAYHDALTGLPNRLLFNDRLSVAVAQAHRQGYRLAIFFLDVDRFKVINDSLGHSLGDRLLQGVARRLQSSVREGDTVARLGGDEFILLLPALNRTEDVAKVAEKILDSLKLPFRLEGRELYVTASMGISLYPDDGGDAETLIKNADTAMYRAKEQGRDNYQLYTPAMNATAVERLALENSLRKALARDELELVYQPLLDLGTGRVHGVEALLRWRHPERGLLLPSEFIPLAEVTGLILPIGPWVLRTACGRARVWQDLGHPHLTVAVNLSARQFQQPDLVAQVKRALEETGLAPRCLDLEITETNAMSNAEATIHTLRELKTLGVRISIDDFGIGYSSLSYLKRLPIDTLKIDQSFVRDITSDPDDAAIATAVIALAHTLKLRVVAEGVETQEQLAFLAARHCDRMQGYLFSRPLPSQECGEFLGRTGRTS
jgi:diguanylate cyclase (GGDEF)-like protein/PAS domain S-box-containing protein